MPPSTAATTAASPLEQPRLNNAHNPPRPGGSRHLAVNQTDSPSRHSSTGSATQTVTPIDSASSRSASPEPLVLHLRGAHNASGTNTARGHRRQITWAEDVIDNEGLGRKSSKVCCIYHKTREFGESSSEEDSSSDSDSGDSDADGSDSPDDGGARMSGNRRGHKHGDDCGHGKGKGRRMPSPNAYEKMPKYGPRQGRARS
ncbi:uncharacterized protein Z518_06163 [Rhinocladiella mackenziei CBS 650.93]|uniref:Type 1 phosphatases regulator n=1 Tax=Rhinocladiella mackenziei CBS 650.93 TaxID=1442369 RepID=A0A0D2IQ28_9EURO|nr:uncharacterized protein Z518_06163 [Rhinocladiella mackenziei CBS 650.93]KIX05291.1 hypothetical protein Z518_06163 [Rhinocladiella mackenziei CBS 650.93]